MVCYVKTCSLLVKNTEHLKANPNSNIFENLENKESWNGTTSKVLTRFFLTAWKVPVLGVILIHIFPHSDQNNSEYGHFLRSAFFWNKSMAERSNTHYVA